MKSILYRPPFIGLLAFVVVLVVQPLGHTVMILMERLFGEAYQYHAAGLMGIVGALMLWIGMRQKGEVASTWWGFFAGTFMWTGWVEFAFVYYSRSLGIPPLMEGGDIVTKPEYLVMPSSIGVMCALIIYFALNKETRCNFFRFFHKHMRLNIGKPSRHYQRNFAGITALETIVVIWFFYIALLVIYDQNILGDRHPVTYGLFFLNTAWAMYLCARLVKFWKVTAAIRYAIPTAIIAWTSIELLGRWDFFTEIWVHPSEYALEMAMVAGAFLLVTAITVVMPSHQKGLDQQQEGAASS